MKWVEFSNNKNGKRMLINTDLIEEVREVDKDHSEIYFANEDGRLTVEVPYDKVKAALIDEDTEESEAAKTPQAEMDEKFREMLDRMGGR